MTFTITNVPMFLAMLFCVAVTSFCTLSALRIKNAHAAALMGLLTGLNLRNIFVFVQF